MKRFDWDMTDEKRALLVDHEASKRLTEAGVLLPCPGCGGDDLQECYVGGGHFVDCQTYGWAGQ